MFYDPEDIEGKCDQCKKQAILHQCPIATDWICEDCQEKRFRKWGHQ